MRDFTEYMCLVWKLFPLEKDGTSETEYIECLHRILSDMHHILYDLVDTMESFFNDIGRSFGIAR